MSSPQPDSTDFFGDLDATVPLPVRALLAALVVYLPIVPVFFPQFAGGLHWVRAWSIFPAPLFQDGALSTTGGSVSLGMASTTTLFLLLIPRRPETFYAVIVGLLIFSLANACDVFRFAGT